MTRKEKIAEFKLERFSFNRHAVTQGCASKVEAHRQAGPGGSLCAPAGTAAHAFHD